MRLWQLLQAIQDQQHGRLLRNRLSAIVLATLALVVPVTMALVVLRTLAQAALHTRGLVAPVTMVQAARRSPGRGGLQIGIQAARSMMGRVVPVMQDLAVPHIEVLVGLAMMALVVRATRGQGAEPTAPRFAGSASRLSAAKIDVLLR